MDLVDCNDISETGILLELAKRFQGQEIYSSIGPIIISLNPYCAIPRLYAEQVLEQYANLSSEFSNFTNVHDLENKKPHAWSAAAAAYLQLASTRQPQAIVISGESGAVKTEATKLCLQLISSIETTTTAGQVVEKAVPSDLSRPDSNFRIEDRVIATNPVLESFGNSKTARNNNSSRFGKWLQVVYAPDSGSATQIRLVGAFITQYLLEKSRVVVHASDERNYHIFYQMCAAGVLDLQPAASYRYLRYSKSIKIAGVDDRREFELTRSSMSSLGFGDKDQEAIFETLKAILLLGNLAFEESKDADGTNSAIISIDFHALLNQIAHLLGIASESLEKSLTGRSMTLRGETQQVRFSVIQAQDAVNALAKELYGRLFCFIINQANTSLSLGLLGSSSSELTIGLLDIFGFEKFKINSLEQLFINYANEKLQQYFITYVLKKEQELYLREEVDFESIVAIDNQDVLDLLESKPNGLFCRLDDEIKIPKASDDSFLKKVTGDHNNSKDNNRRFVKDVKMNPLQFEVRHFAGVIRYDANGFLEKNRDKLHSHLEELLQSSTKQRFREIVTEAWKTDSSLGSAESASAGSASASTSVVTTTIATRFQAQLNQLKDVLNAAEPHFIKCIKPNNSKTERLFEQETVLQQLRYSGVLEAIQVRKSGYPIRRTHESFWKTYWGLCKAFSRRQLLAINESDRAAHVLKGIPHLISDTIRAGHTLMFMKPETLKALDQRKAELCRFGAIKMQSVLRMKQGRNRMKSLVKIRDELVLAINEGKQNGESNCEAIPRLTAAMNTAKKNSLPKKLVQEAEKLLPRLHKVEFCFKKLDEFVNRGPTASNEQNITSEYIELQELSSLAESLSIQSPILLIIRERLEEIKQRAECVLNLRAATENGDEDALAEYVKIARELKAIYGAFCDEDTSLAQQTMQIIDKDYSILSEIVKQFQQLLSRFHGSIGGTIIISRTDIRVWLKSCLDQVRNLTWEDRIPLSRCVQPFTGLLDLFRALHEAWLNDDWETSAVVLQTLRPALDELQLKYPRREDKSALLKSNLDVLKNVVVVEAKLLETEIFDHYVVPKFVRILEEGSKPGVLGSVDPSAFDYDNLAAVIEESQRQEWLGPTIVPAVDMLQRHLDFRGLFIDERWGKVILHCESAHEEERRKLVLRQWVVEIEGSTTFDEAFVAEMDNFATESGAIYERNPISNASPSLARLQAVIDSERDIIFAESIDRFCRSVVKALSEAENLELEEISSKEILAEATQTLSTMKMITSFTAIYSERSFAKLVPSPVMKQLIKLLEVVVDLRRKLLEQNLDEIAAFDHKLLLANIIVSKGQQLSDGDVSTMNILRRQILQIFAYACEQSIENRIAAEMKKNGFEFPPAVSGHNEGEKAGRSNGKDAKDAAKQTLETALNASQAIAAKLFACDYELRPNIIALIAFATGLQNARSAFARKDAGAYREALSHLQQLFEEHQELPVLQILGDILRSEMSKMERMIRYSECIRAMSNALSNGGLAMEYFGPYTTVDGVDDIQYGAPTTMPLLKTKSMSFDVGHAGILPHNVGDVKQILRLDKLAIQEENIDWHDLENAYNQAKQYQEDIESEDIELPEEFENYSQAAEAIINIRKSMRSSDVASALRLIIDTISGKNMRRKIPEIDLEMKTNLPTLSNCGMIVLCETALSRGQPSGPIGLFDFKSISLELLEDAVTVCEAFNDKSPRCLTLYNTVQFIADLRKAEKNGDWVEVSALLAKASTSGIGRTQYTELCMQEINRAIIERDNHDAIQQLQNAIINEEIPSANSSIDFNNVATKELTIALAKVSSMPEDAKGPILSMMSILADSISKMRKAAKERESYLLNLFGVVQDAFDSFRNDLDNLHRPMTSLQRKTMSFRGSSLQRGATFHKGSSKGGGKDYDPGMSFLGSPGPLASPGPAGALRKASLEEFSDLITSIKREMELVKHHFELIDLEKELYETLSSDGIEQDETGAIDLEKIQLEKLQALLVKLETADNSRLSLPAHMKQLRRVAGIILDIRLAVRNDDWESLTVHIEETMEGDSSLWPEYVRQEIKIVRAEQENRWIIKNLTNALTKDRLFGELGDVPLTEVSNKALIDCIHVSKTLKPRSELGIKLLAAAERISVLRGMIMINVLGIDAADALNAIDWNAVKKMAKEIILEIQQRKCDPIILQEARLIAELADDRIVCSAMELALSSGGAKGLPGRLDLSGLSTKDLDKAFQLASRSTLKTQNAKSLLTVSRLVLKLRDFIRRAESSYVMGGLDESIAVWNSIRALLLEITASRQIEPCWELCEQEIDLIQKHALVEDLKTTLTQSAIEASHVYSDRHETSPASDVLLFDVGTQELKALNSELEKILVQSRGATFENDQFSEYISCGTSLCMFRGHIIDRNWQQLLVLTQTKELRNHLMLVKQVKDELSWIMCELHNNLAIGILRNALEGKSQDSSPDPNTAKDQSANDNNNEESNTLGAFQTQSYAERNQALEAALNEAKAYKITSKIAKFWLDCCTNMFQLRTNMALKNNSVVAGCLRWFKTNGKLCPHFVKVESQKAYELHQNDLLVTGLTRALSEGKPSGRRGAMDVSTIRTEAIESLLQQAKTIEPRYKEAEELIVAAETVLDIRRALLTDNMTHLQEIIDRLSYEEYISMDIIEEVAVARAELDNRIAIKSLTDALASFDDQDQNTSVNIDLTFFSATSTPSPSSTENNAIDSSSAQETEDEGSSNRRKNTSSMSILESFQAYPTPSSQSGSGRRYSYANRSSGNIDPNTIDVDVLDTGLRIAQLHGIFSDKAAMLMRTVTLIKSLRIAMKSFDWPLVEEILNEAQFDETCGTRFDPLASREIQVIKNQLEMRAAIVDLSKALKVGWARCSHGLVDTSTMNNEVLSNAIERADHSIQEFGLSSATSSNDPHGVPPTPLTRSPSPGKRRVTFQDQVEFGVKRTQTISKQLSLLMDSAKLVLNIRDLLAVGSMEQAGYLAEEALTGDLHYSVVEELRLYAKEINTALVSMRAAENLRMIAMEGKVQPLQEAIQYALKTHDIHLESDLGLICTLNRAQQVLNRLVFLREHLRNVHEKHEIPYFEALLSFADQVQYGDDELEPAKERFLGLQQFQHRCELLQEAWVFANDERILFRRLLEYANEWNVTNHPYCRRTNLLLKLSPLSLRAVRLSDAIRQPEQTGHYAIITQTLKMKKQYLLLPSSRQKYRLDLFPKLRLPSEYALRMTIVSEELRRGMLTFSEQPLPTSLTYLPAPFAALAVVMFTSCLRGLERNFFSNMEVILYRVVNVGRRCPLLRDELLLLLIKQMRGNPDVKSIQRLFQLLIACLYHFSPSQLFENHLESFLLNCADAQEISIGNTGIFPVILVPYAYRALRYMHHAIFKFGYERVLPKTDKEQRHELKLWFDEEHYDPLLPPFLAEQQATITAKSNNNNSDSLQIKVYDDQHSDKDKDNMMTPLEDLIAADLSKDTAFSSSSQPPFIAPSSATQQSAQSIFQQSQLSPGALVAVTGGFSSLAASAAAITKASVKAAAQAAAAATAANAAAASATPSISTAATSAIPASSNSSLTNNNATVEMASIIRIRGIRENWIHRFRIFNNKNPSKDGGHMTRSKFSYGLALTLTSKSDMDKFDRDIFYFLLLGRKPPLANRSAIYREFINDRQLFHFGSDEEMINSRQRQAWLEQNMMKHVQQQVAASSEMFFAQMQSSDMLGYAERFWDAVILRMSKECVNFPFLHWDREDSISVDPSSEVLANASGEGESERSSRSNSPLPFDNQTANLTTSKASTTSRGLTSSRSFSNIIEGDVSQSSHQQQPPHMLRKAFSQQLSRSSPGSNNNEQDSVSISWEIYREVLLTGMKLLLLQYQSNQTIVNKSKKQQSTNKLLSLPRISSSEAQAQVVDLSSDGEASLMSINGGSVMGF